MHVSLVYLVLPSGTLDKAQHRLTRCRLHSSNRKPLTREILPPSFFIEESLQAVNRPDLHPHQNAAIFTITELILELSAR
ncbi:hypothetical protein PGTUg99_030475 [Puccinia graminis f. sp. tritici]|uniref:Uncharacterized protein n=1 Tax=Puccinia graminis f. sp. tritici TaxID=56615 RepID=A0A5B0RPY3_PUCGR|nr:hypothetical protein PGTUg99_030475 [Puccinia graminis f. sp. tritici]